MGLPILIVLVGTKEHSVVADYLEVVDIINFLVIRTITIYATLVHTYRYEMTRTTPHHTATQRKTTQRNAKQRNATHHTKPQQTQRTTPHRNATQRTQHSVTSMICILCSVGYNFLSFFMILLN